MALWEAIWLGIVQGLTEFLPISSSAHLRIMGEFLPSAQDPGATFTAITQIGTEIAVVVYFRRDLWAIARSWLTWLARPRTSLAGMSAEERQNVRLGWLIVVGTLPIVAVGYFAQDVIRSTFRSLWLVATVLIVFGVVLWVADRWGRRVNTLDTLSVPHGLGYGLAQTLALIPGVSRSGATIAMGRTLGYQRTDAAKFSFLLAVPAVFGSGFYELRTALMSPELTGGFSLTETMIATVVAGLVGFAVIAWLMRYIQTRSFLPFVLYRILLGAALMVALATGTIQPL